MAKLGLKQRIGVDIGRRVSVEQGLEWAATNDVHFIDVQTDIDPNKLESFYKTCSQDLGLNIIGLMCLPPINKNVESYFAKMLNLRNTVDLPDLSMGMSEDYLNALNYQANYLRIGSKIFGNRS